MAGRLTVGFGRSTAPVVDPEQFLEVKYVATPEDLTWGDKAWRWARTGDANVFSKVELLDEASGEVLLGTERKTFAKEDLFQMNPPNSVALSRMSQMSQLYEPCVLYHIRARYERHVFQTYSGLFLVVVNPYTDDVKPVYSADVIKRYSEAPSRADLPPHIFAVAEEAQQTVRSASATVTRTHCILCTGESGAGKTENTKKIIAYLAATGINQQGQGNLRTTVRRTTIRTSFTASAARTLPPPGSQSLKEQLQNANPALEAFGNAATTRNNNSSRFGKMIKIFFDPSGYVARFTCETFLLEKTRVVRQAAGERNFHVFYQLLAGLDTSKLAELNLSRDVAYRYLGTGRPSSQDSGDFAVTERALSLLGVSDEEMWQMWRVVAGILHLGQLTVQEKENEQAYLPADNDTLQKVAEALGISDRTALETNILNPKMSANLASTRRGQNKAQVLSAVESVAKSLHQLLFLFVVDKASRIRGGVATQNFIGLLDIAGFEVFETNSLEQLCINYVNENLQDLFNTRFLIQEQNDYKMEKIEWTQLDFEADVAVTRNTIRLFTQKQGIFDLLDSACRTPGSSDAKFVESLFQQAQSALLSRDRIRTDEPLFTVKHYAGNVTYNAADFLVKNTDKVNHSVLQQLKASTLPLLRQLYGDDFRASDETGCVAMAQHAGRFSSATSLVKKQMETLLATLDNATCSFVRCVVPNRNKKPWAVDARLVYDQLQCNGVIPGLQICKSGYPSRMTYNAFHSRFRLIAASPLGKPSDRDACQRILADQAVDSSQFRLGLTQIFFKEGVIAELEKKLSVKHTPILNALVCRCHGFIVRKLRVHEQESLTLIVPAPAVATEAQAALQRELSEIRDANLSLQEQAQQALSAQTTLQLRLEESERMRAALESQLADINRQKKDLELQLDEQTEAASNFQTLALDLREEVKHLQEVRDQLSEGVSANQLLEEDLARERSARVALAASEETLKAKLEKADLENTTRIAAIDDLTAEKSRLSKLVGRLQSEAAARDTELSTVRQELSTLRAAATSATGSIAQIKGKYDAAEACVQDLRMQLALAQGTIATLEGQNESLQRVVTDRDTEIIELKTRIEALSKGESAVVADLQRSVKEKLALLETTKGELDGTRAKLAETSKQLTLAASNNERYQLQIEGLDERLKEAQTDLDRKLAECTALNGSLASAKAAAEAQALRIADLERSVESLTQRNKSLEDNHKKTLADMLRRGDAVAASQQQDLAHLRAQFDALNAQRDALTHQIVVLEGEVLKHKAAATESRLQAEEYARVLTRTVEQLTASVAPRAARQPSVQRK